MGFIDCFTVGRLSGSAVVNRLSVSERAAFGKNCKVGFFGVSPTTYQIGAYGPFNRIITGSHPDQGINEDFTYSGTYGFPSENHYNSFIYRIQVLERRINQLEKALTNLGLYQAGD